MNIGKTQWGVWGAGNVKHKHTHSVQRDTQGRCSLEQGSVPILTNVGVVPPLIKLMGFEHREEAGGVWRAGNVKHKHSPTHTQCPQ